MKCYVLLIVSINKRKRHYKNVITFWKVLSKGRGSYGRFFITFICHKGVLEGLKVRAEITPLSPRKDMKRRKEPDEVVNGHLVFIHVFCQFYAEGFKDVCRLMHLAEVRLLTSTIAY